MSDTKTPSVLTIGLIHDVFPDETDQPRLVERLTEARQAGARLAVLPELPLDSWIPCERIPRDSDAEPSGGRRHERLRHAACEAKIAVAGGAITVDEDSGERRNRALLFDATGRLLGSYDKLHLPNEPGFWEAEHYRPGTVAPRPVEVSGWSIGLQICSDLFRPTGCQLLAEQGAEVILAPRATPTTSYPRWQAMICSDAITTASYVVSTNRPRPEGEAAIGGPSVVAAPDGSVLAEATEPVTVVALERKALDRSREDYPGYLARRPGLYSTAWAELEQSTG